MTAVGARRARPGSLWRNGDFLAVWSGQIVSTFGSAGSATVVPLLVLATTGSAADAGLIAAISTFPRLLLQLPAGALVDRWNRLRVMRISETLAGVALLAIPTMLWLGRLDVVVLVGAVSVQGCCRMLYGIAERVALPAIVPDALLGDAIAQNEAKSRAAGLIGPMLGGALFGLGRAFPFVADAVSSLGAAVALRFVRADLSAVERAVVQLLWSDIRRPHPLRLGRRWLSARRDRGRRQHYGNFRNHARPRHRGQRQPSCPRSSRVGGVTVRVSR